MTKKKINMSSSGLTRRSSSTPSMSSSCLTRGSRNKDIHSTGFPVKRGMTKDLESGRSMVEMLGVLAIVGVLSVGSIAGYTYAMNKYYANELLAGASERAVLVSAQLLAGTKPTLREFKDNDMAGGKFSDSVEEFEDGGFGLKVSKVKDAVCQNVLKAVDGTEVFIAKDDNAEVLNEMSESDCSGDDNSFLFVYADDMGAIDSIFDPETPTDEEKKEYICTGASAGVYQVLVNNNTTSYRFITSCSECSFAGMYDSDEAAVAAMCEYGSSAFYRCSNSAIYKGNDYYGGEFVYSCNGACTNGYAKYASDEAAIAAMCVLLDEYTCNGKMIMKNGMPVTECAASCTNAGMYDTTDDAIAMMCHSKWRYTCNGKNVMKNGMRVTECGVSCTNAGMYDSDSEAMPAMCNSLFMYTCNGKTIMKNGMPVTECAASCTNASRYYSDEEAIAAMCASGSDSSSPSTTYYCREDRIENLAGAPVAYCSCSEGETYYGTLDSAKKMICYGSSALDGYLCLNGYIVDGNFNAVMECPSCLDGATYAGNEAGAIAALCSGTSSGSSSASNPIAYWCFDGDAIYNDSGYVGGCGHCNSSGIFTSDQEAIDALCLEHYQCSNGILYNISGSQLVRCSCLTGYGDYNSDAAAIAAMCKY